MDVNQGSQTGDARAETRIRPDRARLPTSAATGGGDRERPASVRIEGEPRDLRRILESLERVIEEVDEFTQRKVRILVGEVLAQARYRGGSPRVGLGLEIAEDQVIVEVSGVAEAEGEDQAEGPLSEWSSWLVESITDDFWRDGARATFVIERRRDL